MRSLVSAGLTWCVRTALAAIPGTCLLLTCGIAALLIGLFSSSTDATAAEVTPVANVSAITPSRGEPEDPSDEVPTWATAAEPGQVNNSGQTATRFDGQMATVGQARSLAELRARYQPAATTHHPEVEWPIQVDRSHPVGHSAGQSGQPPMATTGPAQQTPTRPQRPSSELGQVIGESMNDFLADLFGQEGISRRSGNIGGGQGQGTRPVSLDDFEVILGGVTDVVSGLVGSVAGQRAGAQARELLTAAARDVLAALVVSGRYGQGSGAGQDGGGLRAGQGQDNGWGLSNEGQFAGTDREGDVECALSDGGSRTRQPGSLSNRGPPRLLEDPNNSGIGRPVYWWDTEQAAQQALNDRLAVINGQKQLDAAKSRLDAKKITQAEYDKQVSALKASQTTADTSAAQLNPYNSQLLNEVVTGQQNLGTAKTKLDESKKQLDAGKITQAAYDKQAAGYNTQRDKVYAQTAQLRSAAGYAVAGQADPGRDGAGAACSNDGAFAQCFTAAIDPTTGQLKQGQSYCLIGVSGCSASSTAGDRVANAFCDPTKGCGTNTQAGTTTAETTCGTGECNTSSTADSRGADTFCQARNGCTENGKPPTAPDAKDVAAGKREGTSRFQGACTKDCSLAGFANVTQAGSDCHTRNGTCDNNSTGRRGTETAPANEIPAQAARRAKDNGEATSKAHCQASTVGCDTTSTVTAGTDPNTGQRGWLAEFLFGGDESDNAGSGKPAAEAAVRCAQGAKDCTGSATSIANGKTENTETTPEIPAVAGGPATGQTAVSTTPAQTNTGNRVHTGTAGCEVNGGSCATSSGLGEDEGDGVLAHSSVYCADTKNCGGKSNTATTAQIAAGADVKTATRKTDAHHGCTVTGATGDCANDSSSTVTNNNTGDTGWMGQAGPTHGAINPDSRGSSARHTETSDPIAELGKGLTATSKTTAVLFCGSADCKAGETGATSGAASGDIKGVHDSDGVTKCEVHGTGGTCGSAAETTVAYRAEQTREDGATIPVGVVSGSHADAQVRCENAKECGGKSYAETSARDTFVSDHRRGSSDTAECAVRNGGCLGQTSSDASSAPDFLNYDPKAGKPLPGQPTTGPISTSRASASVDCQSKTCEGTARTSAAAWDGGKPRTSEGSVGCEKGATTCQVQTLSNATTGPGAALTYAGDDATVNAQRLGEDPSAASTIGGKLTGQSGGKITGALRATNPAIPNYPGGNKSESSCAGTTGGTCTAVINGGASSGPDANVIRPMVQDQPTQNATTTNTQVDGDTQDGATDSGQNAKTGQTAQHNDGQDSGQPGQTPNQPGTAPGSSANTGGPSVPGASSWTTAWANLNCDGSTQCKGTPRSSATGITANNHQTSGEGTRSPPEDQTTATCDTTSTACQALTTSSAAAGQVIADILTEQDKDAAAEAKAEARQAQQAAAAPGASEELKKKAEQATKTANDAAEALKKPLPEDTLPASWSRSSSFAQCAGPGCMATTTGDTTDLPGTVSPSGAELGARPEATSSHTDATCTATSGGCATSSDATTMLPRDSGQRTKDGKPVPGVAGTAETGSNLICPNGCAGKVTGTANAHAEGSSSTGEGNTKCDDTGPCLAGIRVSLSTQLSAPGVTKEDQFATTSVNIAASCDDGTDTGCPVHATSNSAATSGKNINAKTTTTCEGAAGCIVGASATSAVQVAQVGYQCAGTGGCTAKAEGDAKNASSTSNAVSDCTLGKTGQCAGSVLLGAAEDGSAMAAAVCQGTEGAAKCHCEAGADSQAADKGSGAWAKATAHGSDTNETGGGAVRVSVMTVAKGADARAIATCEGAKNCDTPYSARAEAHYSQTIQAGPEHPDQPSGIVRSNGSGTCEGNGKGGCGVHAWANGKDGGAVCTGPDCSGFKVEQAGASTFTWTGYSYNQILAFQAAQRARSQHPHHAARGAAGAGRSGPRGDRRRPGRPVRRQGR